MGFNAELEVQQFLERNGYAVLRLKYEAGYDLVATKDKEVLYIQVKTITDYNDRLSACFSFKELNLMLLECQTLDLEGPRRFIEGRFPCLAIVLRKWYGNRRRSKVLILLFKGRPYTKRAKYINDELQWR
jgi:hypothetical protein